MMSDRTWSFGLYPKRTGDVGRDRNARTLQFACFLFAIGIGIVVALDAISREPVATLTVSVALAGLVAAAVINRAGRPTWAGRIVILALLLCAVLRVVQARDGFRSHAMLMFPGLSTDFRYVAGSRLLRDPSQLWSRSVAAWGSKNCSRTRARMSAVSDCPSLCVVTVEVNFTVIACCILSRTCGLQN